MKRYAVLVTAFLALTLLISACAPAVQTVEPAAPAATETTAATATSVAATAAEAAATPTTAATATTEATAAPEATATTAGITLQDASGNEVTLQGPAQRIISLAPSNTEILYALGAESQVVAREDFTNYPEAALKLPSVGGFNGKLNLEQITSLQPDLILASPLTPPEQVQSLKEITPNIYVVANPTEISGLYDNMLAVGKLTGHEAEAAQLIEDFQARVKAIEDKVAQATDKPTVFYELDATEPAKPWTAGPGTFIDLLIGMAGGENVGATLSGDWAQISQEELIVQDPDFILLSSYSGVTPDQMAARPGWDAIKAVKNQQVYPFDDDLISRPGPRMVDGLEALAKLLHPDLFK